MSEQERQQISDTGKKITLRHHRQSNFTIISNEIIRNSNLSWKAKGIIAYLLSRPDDWEFFRQEIETRATDGKDSVQSGLRELEKHGYLVRVPKRGKMGRLDGWEWHIFEDGSGKTIQPIDDSTVRRKTRQTVNPSDGKHATNNTDDTNTNNTNTDINNNEEAVVGQITQDEIVDIFSRNSIGIGKKKANQLHQVAQKMKLSERNIEEVAEVLAEKVRRGMIRNPIGILLNDPENVIGSIQDGTFYASSTDKRRKNSLYDPLYDPEHENFFNKKLV